MLIPLLITTPLLSAFFTLSLPFTYRKNYQLGFLASLPPFLIAILLWLNMDLSSNTLQFTYQSTWLYPINFGLDGVSILLILLTTFLTPLCILIGWKPNLSYPQLYIALFLIMESFIIGAFSILDLFFFYIFFETILIPMFLIIGIWGSRERKITAAYQFFLYTFAGSLFMFTAILYISTNFQTTDISSLSLLYIPFNIELLLWLLFFLSFAIKIPMFPFHVWLPEAHVEAPTAGSVILAGILLKLGAFGFLRISLPLFPNACFFFSPIILLLSTLSIIYISLTTIRQIDLKKLIAYSSIAHMGFVTAGLFTHKIESLQGGIITLISHGLIASGLFITIGLLYDRHKTRIIKYYRGLAIPMPIFNTLKFILILANIAFPLTSSFIGEFLTLNGIYKTNKFTCLISSIAIILSAIYMIWYYNRIAFGTITPYLSYFNELSKKEFLILLPILLLIVLLGSTPNCLHMTINPFVYNLIY
jgi:proton-translocating NADH-quinone oxidoreductase chain M